MTKRCKCVDEITTHDEPLQIVTISECMFHKLYHMMQLWYKKWKTYILSWISIKNEKTD